MPTSVTKKHEQTKTLVVDHQICLFDPKSSENKSVPEKTELFLVKKEIDGCEWYVVEQGEFAGMGAPCPLFGMMECLEATAGSREQPQANEVAPKKTFSTPKQDKSKEKNPQGVNPFIAFLQGVKNLGKKKP